MTSSLSSPGWFASMARVLLLLAFTQAVLFIIFACLLRPTISSVDLQNLVDTVVTSRPGGGVQKGSQGERTSQVAGTASGIQKPGVGEQYSRVADDMAGMDRVPAQGAMRDKVWKEKLAKLGKEEGLEAEGAEGKQSKSLQAMNKMLAAVKDGSMKKRGSGKKKKGAAWGSRMPAKRRQWVERVLRFNATRAMGAWPPVNEVSRALQLRNSLPPRNARLFQLKDDHLVVVLYVHNRTKYLQVALSALSRVQGISETLLIVSHDGLYVEMDELVREIKFCQVKQIYAPWSPHIFPDSFPGHSSGDCIGKKNGSRKCSGDPDDYGSFRDPKIVSLKHHWWWLMNTVWDGLEETRTFDGYVLFLEEDHFALPNAYRHAQALTRLMGATCPECVAATLAPSRTRSRGEPHWRSFVAEKMGNMGYIFNRAHWHRIRANALRFCTYDDYNWDITLWNDLSRSWPSAFALRWCTPSVVHFGTCGLHGTLRDQQDEAAAPGNVPTSGESDDENEDDEARECVPSKVEIPNSGVGDRVEVRKGAPVRHLPVFDDIGENFLGWGGWGDRRDHALCLYFSEMYRSQRSPPVPLVTGGIANEQWQIGVQKQAGGNLHT